MTAGGVRLDQPAQVRLFGKGRRTRSVPLMDPTARLLRDHLREHGLDRAEKFQEPVFQNRQGRALTRWAATRGVLVRQTPTPAQERLLPMPSAAKNRSPRGAPCSTATPMSTDISGSLLPLDTWNPVFRSVIGWEEGAA